MFSSLYDSEIDEHFEWNPLEIENEAKVIRSAPGNPLSHIPMGFYMLHILLTLGEFENRIAYVLLSISIMFLSLLANPLFYRFTDPLFQYCTFNDDVKSWSNISKGSKKYRVVRMLASFESSGSELYLCFPIPPPPRCWLNWFRSSSFSLLSNSGMYFWFDPNIKLATACIGLPRRCDES